MKKDLPRKYANITCRSPAQNPHSKEHGSSQVSIPVEEPYRLSHRYPGKSQFRFMHLCWEFTPSLVRVGSLHAKNQQKQTSSAKSAPSDLAYAPPIWTLHRCSPLQAIPWIWVHGRWERADVGALSSTKWSESSCNM